MARFFVGQRIKKVRGENPGAIGRVSSRPIIHIWALAGCDISVQVEVPHVGEDVFGAIVQIEVGTICATHSHCWEPILDNHEPCESEFKASLDELLERVGEAA